MEKSKLKRFISKYSLGGLCTSATIKYSDSKFLTAFKTDSNDLLGFVSVKDIDIDSDEVEFGIFNTVLLQRVLSAMRNEIDVTFETENGQLVTMGLSDGTVNGNVLLVDLNIMPDTPSMKQVPDFQETVQINPLFIDRFIKSRNAISHSNTFALIKSGNKLELVINHSDSHSTDNISITLSDECESDGDFTMHFNSDLLKEVLNANKDITSGSIQISPEGLILLNVSGEDFICKYYIVMVQV